MTWTSYGRPLRLAALGAVLVVALSANKCDDKRTINVHSAITQAPEEFKACVHKAVTKLPKRDLTPREAEELLIKVRASELAKDRCGKGLLAWTESYIRAQHSAYYVTK